MIRTLINRWSSLAAVLVLLAGCSAPSQPVYQNKHGFRITPPPTWVERARDDALPAKPGRKQPDLPLPPLRANGNAVEERMLVRYDRLTAGNLAWMRVSVADVPASTPLKEFVSANAPGREWKRESEPETLELSGRSAIRIAFTGIWSGQGYINETVAVRHGEQVYFITASFPVSDGTAREKVRKAVAGASWQK